MKLRCILMYTIKKLQLIKEKKLLLLRELLHSRKLLSHATTSILDDRSIKIIQEIDEKA